jgi:hypothetical protein
LIVKSDNPSQKVIFAIGLEKQPQNSLLHILHTGGLHGDNSRCLQRLRHEGNLHRHLRTRFEDINSVQLRVIPPVWKEILSGVKYLGKSTGPDSL